MFSGTLKKHTLSIRTVHSKSSVRYKSDFLKVFDNKVHTLKISEVGTSPGLKSLPLHSQIDLKMAVVTISETTFVPRITDNAQHRIALQELFP